MPFLGKFAGNILHARAEQALTSRDAAVYGGDVYRPLSSPQEAGARMCGAAGCAGSWNKPWKNRRRPIFEDEWGCSGRCLHSMVRSAVRRELGEGAANDDVPHRHRVPLGLVLLAQGWITHPQLQRALEAQKASGTGRIGDWLAESCGLGEEHITRGLGVQWSCPVLSLDGYSPSSMALVLPKKIITEFNVLPLRVAGSSLLYLGSPDRMNAALSLAVEQMSGLRVESGLVPARQFDTARASLLAAESVPAESRVVADADALTSDITRLLEQRQPIATRLVRLHQYYWLRMWLESGAQSGIGSLPSSTEDVSDHLFRIG